MSGAAVERRVTVGLHAGKVTEFVLAEDYDRLALNYESLRAVLAAAGHDADIAALTAELQQCREALEAARKYVCAIRDQASIAAWAEVNRDLQKVDAALKERT